MCQEFILEVNRSVFYLNELTGGYLSGQRHGSVYRNEVNSHITMLTFRASLMLDLVESQE